MAPEYIDTPASERVDATNITYQHVDFSFAQPFASPSKNPQDNLRNHMRGIRNTNGQTKTPRVRNPLLSKRDANPAQKQEFTPLLKSAKRNQLLRQSILEEKENSHSNGIPDMPATFRSSYASPGTQLPVSSSMLDADHTGSSANVPIAATPMPPVETSSMLDSTPIPHLSKRGEGGVLDQGNVLTLRDQEAKLDQIQKDNFGLKLKIHYLEEALRKTGTAFQQATLKENVELKTRNMTMEQDLKRQRKRLQSAEQELEEYRLKFQEYRETLKRRHENKDHAEELEKLRKQAKESQSLANERAQEIQDLKRELELEKTRKDDDELQRLNDDIQDLEAEVRDHQRQIDEKDEQLEGLREQLIRAESGEAEEDSEEVQRLRDDLQDAEAEVRDRDRQLEEKDEKLESLEEQLKKTKANDDEAARLQQDIDELEAELNAKDAEIVVKDRRIGELQDQINNVQDREKSTKKLRGDVADLEAQLRAMQEELDESNEQRRTLVSKQNNAEATYAATLRQRDNDIQNVHRELADKEGEINALQERLQTARGSWDSEAQQTDVRLQEKDRIIKEKEERLREKSGMIEERDDELVDLQRRLRSIETEQTEVQREHNSLIRTQAQQIRDLEEKMRAATSSLQLKLEEKDSLIETRGQELRAIQNRLTSLQAADTAAAVTKNGTVRELEAAIAEQTSKIKDQSQEIILLQARLSATETPSKARSLLKEQTDKVHTLQRQLLKLEQDKDAELDDLEQQLQELEIKNAQLESKSESLRKRAEMADRDQSLLGHQDSKLRGQHDLMETMENELEQLRVKLQSSIDQRQIDVSSLERELERIRASRSNTAQETERRTSVLQAEHAEVKQALEDEILVLEDSLDKAQSQKATLEAKCFELESEVRSARLAKDNETPRRERNNLRVQLKSVEQERDECKAKLNELEKQVRSPMKRSGAASKERDDMLGQLRNAEIKMKRLQENNDALESELLAKQQSKGSMEERRKLRELVDQANTESDELQTQLTERDRKLAGAMRKETELRGELEDLQIKITELEAQAQRSLTKERELRSQLQTLRDAKSQLEDLEVIVGERKNSSSSHARREAELRTQLSAVRADLEGLQQECAEHDSRMRASMKRERSLQKQLEELHIAADNERTVDEKHWNKQLAVAAKRHEGELKGLARQIQFLRAKCAREEAFRGDLVFAKAWFLMQVRMYQECNQADLRLLEDIGVVPDATIRQRRPNLRTVGVAIIACLRIQSKSQAWAVHRDVHESLVRKLEGMRRK